MITFLLLNCPVLLLATVITHAYSAHKLALDKVLSVAVLYFLFIILVEQLLGLLNILTLENILLLNCLGMAYALFLIRCHKDKARGAGGPLEGIAGIFPESTFAVLVLSLIAGFALVKLSFNLINPPLGWDSLNYHFPFAVEWLKHKNLDTPLVVSDNPCPSYYPLNGSLVYLWLIFPFKNVFLADIGQFPFFVLAFLSVYNICSKLGVSRMYSFFSASLLTVTPNYFKQLSIGYVDVMVCAWFLIALNFLLNLVQRFDWQDVALFSLALGMLVGTKTIALAYAAILLVFFVFLLIKKHDLSSLYALLTFVILSALAGGFSYIRNFFETGNPFYPMAVAFWGNVIFPGVMDKTNFTAFALPGDYNLMTVLFHEGMGGGIELFVIPGFLLFVYTLFRKKGVSAQEWLLLGCFIFLYLVYRYIFSLPNVRYLYPMIALGYIISFYALSKTNFPSRVVEILVFITVLASLPEIARYPELIYSVIISLIIFLILAAGRTYLKKRYWKVSLVFIAALFSLFAIMNLDYNKNEYRRYIKTMKYSGFWPDAVFAWDWLNNNTRGNNIAYIGRPVPLPLYGTNFKNNVYYASVNSTDPAKLHYFPGSRYCWGADFLSLHKSFEAAGNYRGGADFSVWLGNLLKRHTEYLFVYSLHQTKDILFPLEDAWAKAHPLIFKPVFINSTIHIFKIMK
jgi:hypothetical protein